MPDGDQMSMKVGYSKAGKEVSTTLKYLNLVFCVEC